MLSKVVIRCSISMVKLKYTRKEKLIRARNVRKDVPKPGLEPGSRG